MTSEGIALPLGTNVDGALGVEADGALGVVDGLGAAGTLGLGAVAIFDPARNAAPLTSSNVLSVATLQKQEAARKKAEADAARRSKELALLQKKTLDTQKKSLALQKASKTLNLDAIGIEAALKGKISETDRISLLLQKAILEGNATMAEQLSAQLEQAIKRNNELRLALLATPEAPNPFRNWTMPGFNVPSDSYAQFGPQGGLSAGVIAGVNPTPPINITVELDGQTVGGAIRDGQINDSLSGSFNQVNRGQGFKGAVAL